jgi:amidase
MRSGQIGDLDATAQAALVARGELSAAEVIEAAIERIERLNPVLNCVIFPRYERACAEARALATDAASPFAGVPFLMKDLIQTVAGEPFSWGWKPLKDARMRARATSYVAAKFGAAGLISLGQTTVPEWGVSLSTETAAWGVTHNPWKLGHAAGGSSGGAASAVAARLVPIAHANDGGGSIRIPAAFCGLVGLRYEPSLQAEKLMVPSTLGAFWRRDRCAEAATEILRPGKPTTNTVRYRGILRLKRIVSV